MTKTVTKKNKILRKSQSHNFSMGRKLLLYVNQILTMLDILNNCNIVISEYELLFYSFPFED